MFIVWYYQCILGVMSYFTTICTIRMRILQIADCLLVKEFFKIREHLANLQAKWSIVSCAPFASRHCPQRC